MNNTNPSDMEQGFSSSQTPPDAANEHKPPFDPEMTVVNKRVRRERGELRVGDMMLGRYEILDKLGSGAMGVVFKCRDRLSKVDYALKMVPPELACDTDAMEDVRENFQLIHGLKHPNIASTDFLDRDEYGAYFLLMEYAPGITLSQWIKQKWRDGRPDSNEIVKIVRQIASALDYAHRKHVLHRDVKPTNVMVDEHCEVKVLDFGLASKVHNTKTSMSLTTSMTSGTPSCLSPEQFRGRYPSPAADQYALGVLAYQMLAGHLPFESDDYDILRSAVVNEPPELIPGISDKTNNCIQKALSKDPKSRYSTCMEFADNLTQALSEPSAIQDDDKKNAESAGTSEPAEQDRSGKENAPSSAENKGGNRIRQTTHQWDARSILVAALYYTLTSIFFGICLFEFVVMILLALIHLVLSESAGADLTAKSERIFGSFGLGFILLFLLLSLSAIFVRKTMRNQSVFLNVLTLIGVVFSTGILVPIVFYSWFPAGLFGKIVLFVPPFLCLFYPFLSTRDKAKVYLLRSSVKLTFYTVSWLGLFRMMISRKKNSFLHSTAHQ